MSMPPDDADHGATPVSPGGDEPWPVTGPGGAPVEVRQVDTHEGDGAGMAFQLGRLAQAVDDASNRITEDRIAHEDARVALEDRIAASHRKLRWSRAVAYIAAGAAVIATITGGVATIQARSAERAAATASEDVEHARDALRAARLTTCIAYNDDLVTNVNALNDRTQDLLRTSVSSNTTRTPEEQARIAALLVQELEKYEAVKIPKRDCSPRGLDEFYPIPE